MTQVVGAPGLRTGESAEKAHEDLHSGNPLRENWDKLVDSEVDESLR